MEHAPGGDADAADEGIRPRSRGSPSSPASHQLVRPHACNCASACTGTGTGGGPVSSATAHISSASLQATRRSAFRTRRPHRPAARRWSTACDTRSACTPPRSPAFQLVQHFLRIGVPGLHMMAFRRFPGGVRADIRHRHHFHQPLCGQDIQGREMSAVADHTATDQSYATLFHCSFPPNIFTCSGLPVSQEVRPASNTAAARILKSAVSISNSGVPFCK